MKIIEYPSRFKNGIRAMLLVSRRKDGEENKSIRKFISSNEEEFNGNLKELLRIAKKGQRIYFTGEERDIDKAIRIFKERQLDADFYDIDSKHSFYKDIKNRWISCLMNNRARKESLFLADADSEDEITNIEFEIVDKNLSLVYRYKTKNGEHFILEPFNPSLVSFEVKKNFLSLLAY